MRAGTYQSDDARMAMRHASERERQRNNARKTAHRREEVEMERAAQAALPPQKLPAKRICLCCRRPFASKHIGNRLCGNCKDLNL